MRLPQKQAREAKHLGRVCQQELGATASAGIPPKAKQYAAG